MYGKFRLWLANKLQVCQHSFQTIHKFEIVIRGRSPDRVTGMVYHQQCTKCGVIKQIKLDAL